MEIVISLPEKEKKERCGRKDSGGMARKSFRRGE
jgi:hypothetical protein